MSMFEWWSVGGAYGVGLIQCGLIAWGIWVMRQGNANREASTELMIQQSKALERQSQALERLLERTA